MKSKFLQKLSKLWFINSIWMKKKVIFLFIGFQSFVAFSQQKSINQKVEDLLKQMTLEEKINTDLKAAMLSKNEAALRGLRAVKSALLLAKTSGANGVSAEDEFKILQKLVKQRKESVDIYKQQNREDLAKSEVEEIEVIEKYLQQMMGEEEIKNGIQAIIAQVGAKGPGDLGKVMGAASKNFAGKADNKLVSQLVKDLLAAM